MITIEEVLEAHKRVPNRGMGFNCSCGWTGQPQARDWNGHIAQAITDAGFGLLTSPLSSISPDCRDKNHQKCPGDAWDEVHDHATECQCACHAVGGSPETMSPGQEAWFDYRKEYGSWPEPEIGQVHKHFCAGFDAAKLRVIDTDAELQAAPDRIIVQAADGTVAARYDAERGVVFGDNRPFPWSALRAPAVVLREAM